MAAEDSNGGGGGAAAASSDGELSTGSILISAEEVVECSDWKSTATSSGDWATASEGVKLLEAASCSAGC
jgi:hypothetical protein